MWSLVKGRHGFRGFKDTTLQYDPIKEQWIMGLYSTNETFALTNSTEYPFGLHVWEIVGDSCFTEKVNFVTLNVNACDDFEFNCDDGNCVPIEERCDGKVQCPDKTGILFTVLESQKMNMIVPFQTKFLARSYQQICHT